MMDIGFLAWLATRPPVIQELAKKYPPQRYVMKDGAPYGLTCAGTIVNLFGYCENGDVTVVIMAEDKTPNVKAHEKYLGQQNGISPDEMEDIHNSDTKCQIDPQWMTPLN